MCSFEIKCGGIQLILVVLFLFSSCAATKYKLHKKPLTEYFKNNPVFRESHTGLVVYDPEVREIIFDHHGQKHFTPASNMKLLTYFASTKLLGDSIPSLRFSEVNDTVYFTGTGAPTLLYENYDYDKTWHFLKKASGSLVYIHRPTIDARLGPGWSWDDYPYYYSVERSSFPIYGNIVTFQKDSMSDHISANPSFFTNDVSAEHDKHLNQVQIDRAEFENRFRIKYGEAPFEIDEVVPFMYSRDLFITLLEDTLKKPIAESRTLPEAASKLFYGVPTDSVTKQVLTISDNFLAEQLLIVMSSQLSDTLSASLTINNVMDNHLAELKDAIHWVDGSGLSRYNQITPEATVLILEKLYEEIPKDKLYHLLPVSGKSGTLKNSFKTLEGRIHAKTGSMSHVYNLSGFLETKSGKTLLFSFMNNNFNVSFSELKLEMERVLSVFANNTK